MSLATEIDDIREGLKQRLPTYGMFDGIAAILTLGFLNAICPAKPPRRLEKRQSNNAPSIRPSSAISKRITHG